MTKDCKSLLVSPRREKPRRWTRLHAILLISAVVVAGTIMVLVSFDATASKHAAKKAAEKQAEAARQLITVPLDFPALKAASSTQPQAELLPVAASLSESLAEEKEQAWHTVKVKRGDSLAVIFKKQNLSASELHQIMTLGKVSQPLKRLRPGQKFHFQWNDTGQLLKMKYEINRLDSLLVQRDTDNSFHAQIVSHNLEKRLAYASGEISSSLFEAGKLAGMQDSLIMDLVAIFGWDIDFALDIRKGDRFALLYQEQFIKGKKVNNGSIVAAEFTNQGRTFRAVRYTDAKGHSDYYTPDGHSMRKAFLRTPVDFRRISSRFGKRKHPVLNKKRMHKGVDYAAKRGTPIKAAGDGKIIFRGTKGGYGRVVILQHGGRYSTLYAHMNGFKRGQRVGARVKQGQIIGYVGSSGRATGPHLHYEFRVNGSHRNPLTIRLPDAAPINTAYKQDFLNKTTGLLSQLDMYTTRVALIDN